MNESNNLYILWTNPDVLTSQFMVMMYATNSKIHNWWNDVTVIIWGATAKLVAENDVIQERIKMAMQVGVKISACISCARELGVIEDLKNLGIEVKPWGEPLSEILKSNEKLITI